MSMDKIYFPKTDNPIINLGQRYSEYKAEVAVFPGLNSSGCGVDDDDTASLAEAFGWTGTADEFVQLNNSVSLDQLAHENDLRFIPYDPSQYRPLRLSRLDIPTKAVATLRTLASHKTHIQRMTPYERTRFTPGRTKYRYVPIPPNDADDANADLEPGGELLVFLRVYAPFKYIPQSTARMRLLKMKQRIVVLGSQTLSQLRDRIDCVCSTHGPFTDISLQPRPAVGDDKGDDWPDDGPVAAKRKAKQPQLTKPSAKSASSSSSSGSNSNTTGPPQSSQNNDPAFFFITDTFYNDSRHKCAADYTQPIREWAALHPHEVGPMAPVTEDMQTTRLADLRVRIGSPLVYQHSGNCEHVFTVSDVRLLAAADPLQRRHYPLVDMVLQRQRQRCDTCGMAEAAVVVCDSVQHLQDPAYLCDVCFGSFHYVDGVKVDEFRAYAFVGNRAGSVGGDDSVLPAAFEK